MGILKWELLCVPELLFESTTLNHIDMRMILPKHECSCMVHRLKWYWKQKYCQIHIPYWHQKREVKSEWYKTLIWPTLEWTHSWISWETDLSEPGWGHVGICNLQELQAPIHKDRTLQHRHFVLRIGHQHQLESRTGSPICPHLTVWIAYSNHFILPITIKHLENLQIDRFAHHSCRFKHQDQVDGS